MKRFGWQEGHPACRKTGCWFVGSHDLTGALCALFYSNKSKTFVYMRLYDFCNFDANGVVRCTWRRKHWRRSRAVARASRQTGWDEVCTGLKSLTIVVSWAPSWSSTFVVLTRQQVSSSDVRHPSNLAPYTSTPLAGSWCSEQSDFHSALLSPIIRAAAATLSAVLYSIQQLLALIRDI